MTPASGELSAKVEKLKADNAPPDRSTAAEKALGRLSRWTPPPPRPPGPRRRRSPRAPGRRCATPRRSRARTSAARDVSRRNFLALVFCLMVGTAALPHILMRYYTTPSVRQARESVFWSLFFIFLLYFTAPALGVLAKFDVYSFVVGIRVRQIAAVGRVVAESRPGAAVDRRRQQGRHRAARGNRDRRRHHRAGDAGDRGPAVRGLGPGRRRRIWRRRCPPPTACC